MEKFTVTISRQFASLGRSIAQELSENMGIEFYDRDIVEATAKRMGQPISVISHEEEYERPKFFKRAYPLGMGAANLKEEIYNVQANIIEDLAAKESCIIVGRGANDILRNKERCLNIFIYAPVEARLKNCVDVLQMKEKNAKKMLADVDKARETYRLVYGKQIKNVYDGYDIMIDSSRFGVEQSAKMIEEIIKMSFL